MSVEENKNIVRSWINSRNNSDLEAARNVIVEVWHERLSAGFNGMTSAFPDLHITIEDMFGEGDKVAIKWTFHATHSGTYQDIPATKKQVTMTGIDIYTIKNGKIEYIDRQTDNLGLLKQMGVTLSWQGEIIT